MSKVYVFRVAKIPIGEPALKKHGGWLVKALPDENVCGVFFNPNDPAMYNVVIYREEEVKPRECI